MVKTVLPGKVYRHFKGGLYKIIDLAKDCETLKTVVVYQSILDGQVWVRDYDDFTAKVPTPDGIKQRFSLQKPVNLSLMRSDK